MRKKLKLISVILFILLEACLWILVLNTSGNLYRWLSFLSVLCAFIFSLLFINVKSRTNLTQFALLFTVISDVFLILIDPINQAMAMTFFSIVQILYFIRIIIETKNKKINLANIITRLAAVIIIEIITIILLGDKTDYVSLISMFYYVNLILNVVFAFINLKKSWLLTVGLILFLLCDTFVGLSSAIDVYISISSNSWIYKLVFADFNFVWFFYIPAQTCLSLSAVFKKS